MEEKGFKFIENSSDQYCICTTDKLNVTFTISKLSLASRQFMFTTDKGTIPKELEGGYSSIDTAKKAFVEHYKKQRHTTAAKAKQRKDRSTPSYATKLVSKEC